MEIILCGVVCVVFYVIVALSEKRERSVKEKPVLNVSGKRGAVPCAESENEYSSWDAAFIAQKTVETVGSDTEKEIAIPDFAVKEDEEERRREEHAAVKEFLARAKRRENEYSSWESAKKIVWFYKKG